MAIYFFFDKQHNQSVSIRGRASSQAGKTGELPDSSGSCFPASLAIIDCTLKP